MVATKENYGEYLNFMYDGYQPANSSANVIKSQIPENTQFFPSTFHQNQQPFVDTQQPTCTLKNYISPTPIDNGFTYPIDSSLNSSSDSFNNYRSYFLDEELYTRRIIDPPAIRPKLPSDHPNDPSDSNFLSDRNFHFNQYQIPTPIYHPNHVAPAYNSPSTQTYYFNDDNKNAYTALNNEQYFDKYVIESVEDVFRMKIRY